MSGIDAYSLQMRAWAPGFLGFGFLIGGALLVGGSVTELVSPRPVAALLVAAPASSVSVEDIIKIFDQSGAIAPQSADLALTGVYVKGGSSGFATFRSSRGPRLVDGGGELDPGPSLAAVAPDRVTLRDRWS